MALLKNNHGGKRPGAGRPKGSAAFRKQAAARQYSSDGGLTPLDVLILSMREAYDQGDKATAIDCAKAAAPYMHPRLANVQTVITDPEGNSVNLVPQITIEFPSVPTVPAATAPLAAITSAEVFDVEEISEAV